MNGGLRAWCGRVKSDQGEGRVNQEVMQSFAEFAGVYLHLVQANHEALTRELQLYQTLFNPALDTVRGNPPSARCRLRVVI